MSTCVAGEREREMRKPLYRTRHIVEGDFPGLSSIQVGSSHRDESAADTRPIVGMDLGDVGNLSE